MTSVKLTAAALLTLLAFGLPARAEPIQWAAGTWEADPAETADRGAFVCGRDPLVVSIDTQAMRFQTSRSGQTYTGQIINSEENVLILRYDNDQRKNEKGEVPTWVMKFPDPNSFYWVMEDWVDQDSYKRMPKRRRC